jgi:hypothetical protein
MILHRHNLAQGQGTFIFKNGFAIFVEPDVPAFQILNERKLRSLWQAHIPDQLDTGLWLGPLVLAGLEVGCRVKDEEDAAPEGKPTPQSCAA